jgi:hypothetical protein
MIAIPKVTSVLLADLADAGAESLLHLLGQRHPQLPVVCVEEAISAAAAGHGWIVVPQG